MIKVLVSLFAVYVIVRAYLRLREGAVSPPRFVAWLIVWLGVAVVTWTPQVTDRISGLVGVQRGVEFFLFVAVLMLAYLIFTLYVKIEQNRREMTDLVRQLALQGMDAPPAGSASQSATSGVDVDGEPADTADTASNQQPG